MSITSFPHRRGYRFRALALELRGRARLTQRELAATLGVSERAIQNWEGDLGYPSAEHLKGLIAAFARRGAFAAGREVEEAEALWEAVRTEARRLLPPFDRTWVAGLLGQAASAATTTSPSALPEPGGATISAADAAPPGVRLEARRQDWGAAPDVAAFHGRGRELETLTRWVLAERCRVVAVLGLGGIGKTALAARLAHDLVPQFNYVFWRSLQNAPPPEDWLAGAVGLLSAQQTVPPEGLGARLVLLLDLLRERRCLLVLDNLETVLEPGTPEGRYRDGYAGYGMLLRRLGEARHASCLLVTSREKPPELAPLEGDDAPVRSLRLGGLGVDEGRALLHDKGLAGDETAWQALVARYGGNPLVLKIVGAIIAEVFGGDIAPFLDYTRETYGAVFGGIRRLLDEQVRRLSDLERALLYWLAVEREPVGFGELVADLGLGPGMAQAEVLEAVEALGRRSLLERATRSAITLQPVVLEYTTEQLVRAVCQEVLQEQPMLLVSHALVQATAKDYVRRSQEQLIARPLLERLVASCGDEAVAARQLQQQLDSWRGRPVREQGYGPGNIVNLLRLLWGHVRNLDLSYLGLREVYLQETEAHNASLVGADLTRSAVAEAFDHVACVALSVDGLYLAAGTTNGTVHLWRVTDRAPLLSTHGHTGWVFDVALSADGRLIASGGLDGLVMLWDADSGLRLTTLRGHAGGVIGVALSADGRLVASGSHDGTIRLWEADSRRCLAILQGHNGTVYRVTLSADGRLAASGGYDGTVMMWDVASGQQLATLKGHTGAVLGVALSGDGRLVASGALDGTVMLWDSGNGRRLSTLQGHAGGVIDVALSADGRLAVSGGYDGLLMLWDVASGQRLFTLHGHAGAVLGVTLSADGDLVASGGLDGTVALWEAKTGHCLARLQGHTGGVYDVALSADGRLVADGRLDGTIALWDGGSGACLARLHGHIGGVLGVVLSADGRLVVSGGLDGTVKLWDASSGEQIAALHGHASGVIGVALSADGRLVASGGYDGVVIVWDVASGQRLATLEGHTGGVHGVALSADGRLLASGGLDGLVTLWEARSGQRLATLQGHTGGVHDTALSADGRLVASTGLDGTVKLWEASTGACIHVLRGHSGVIWGVALSADGQLLASGGADGTVRLWETCSGHALATLPGHVGGVIGVALSADGRLLASGSLDGAVMLWETSSHACLRALRPQRRYEGMDITGLTGVTEAQKVALKALGAVTRGD